MKTLIAATLGATLAISAPVYAQDVAQSSETSVTSDTKKDADDGDRMVCKRTAVTGTRIKKRTCYTADQWARIEEASRRTAEELKSLGGIDSTNRGG